MSIVRLTLRYLRICGKLSKVPAHLRLAAEVHHLVLAAGVLVVLHLAAGVLARLVAGVLVHQALAVGLVRLPAAGVLVVLHQVVGAHRLAPVAGVHRQVPVVGVLVRQALAVEVRLLLQVV